jgi:hypothetical protein
MNDNATIKRAAWDTMLGLVTAHLVQRDDDAEEMLWTFLEPSVQDDSINPEEFIARVVTLLGLLSSTLAAFVQTSSDIAGTNAQEAWQRVAALTYGTGLVDAAFDEDEGAMEQALLDLIELLGGDPDDSGSA